MAKITTPVKGFEGKIADVTFVDGVGETDDEIAIAYFERQGYGVETTAAQAPAYPADEPPQEKWTHDQLDAFAADRGIDFLDLKALKKKADKVEAILAALPPASAPSDPDDSVPPPSDPADPQD